MSLTEVAFSPPSFRLWAAISLLAGAMERRVWLKMGPRLTYPNLFTFLVAPPGVGKSVIQEVRNLWRATLEPGTKVKTFHVAPDNVSKASLLDCLAKTKELWFLPEGGTENFSSLLVAAEEFQNLLPEYNKEYLGVLNSIYTNPPEYEEERRTGSVKSLNVENPQLNIIGGVQPGWLASTFPPEAWSTGFTSRLMMIYSTETPLHSLFFDPGEPVALRGELLRKLGLVSQMYGLMRWEPEAAAMSDEWYLAGGPPRPTHPKLEYYCNRRGNQHMPKLAMISAIAARGEMVVRTSDITRAIFWLAEAEVMMPDIFRAMVGKSDTDVIEELHAYVTQLWNKDREKAVHISKIYGFLRERVPAPTIEKLMHVMETEGIIVRLAGTEYYYPKAKYKEVVT